MLRAIGSAEVVERALLEAASSGRQWAIACTDCDENDIEEKRFLSFLREF